MARQRFIHPEIWKDPLFGKLTPTEQVLFIGLFSIADDEGRLVAEPAFLRSELFPYKDYTNKKVQGYRDAVVEKCPNVHLYRAEGVDYIALLKWHEYQKPKYPKESKLPAPFLEHSPTLPPTFPKGSSKASAPGRAGLGREGLGQGLESADADAREREISKMLVVLNGASEDSRRVLMRFAAQLPLGAVAKVRESVELSSVPVGVGWAVNALKSELEERGAA